MAAPLIFLIIFCQSVLQLVLGEINENCSCTTPQYFEYGKKGTIVCNFQSSISDIYWYNSTDSLYNPPLVSWNKELGGTYGNRYSSLEYDIQPNGSLVINKTISHGDGYFKVVMLSNGVIACEQTVQIIIVAKPEQSYPVIDKCDSKRYCYKRCDNDSPMQLTCHLNGTGLFGTILWEMWTSGEPQTMKLNTSLANKVEDRANISVKLPCSGRQLEVLLCKIARNHPYDDKSSMILIERTRNPSDTQVTTIKPIIRKAQMKSPLRLECGKSKRVSFVWKKCQSENKDGCVEIVHFSLENKVILVNGYNADNSGALLVEEVKALHESWYWCLSSDGRKTIEKNYRVDVYALPVPPKLIVEDCDGNNPCNVKSRREGNLTCTLFGIRPEARLEWVITSMYLHEIISFSERETRVIFHDDVYDIAVRTLYVVKKYQYSTIDLECRATVNITNISNLSTTIQLHLSDVDTSSDTGHKKLYALLAFIVLVLISLCFSIIYITKVCRKRQRSKQNKVEGGEPLNIQQNTNKRELLKNDFEIKLWTFKVNIAQHLGTDDALVLSSLLDVTQEEERTLKCSKNPAIELIDMLLNGDEKLVMCKLCKLEKVSKQREMTEVNELSNTFIREYYRQSFVLKVNLMKNGDIFNEAESLLHKMLWDYSQCKTISELETFFNENYNTSISSVEDGSLVVRLEVPTTKWLNKLLTDIHTGTLTKRIFPILNNIMKLDYNHEDSPELYISGDEIVYGGIQKILGNRDYTTEESGNNAHGQYESSQTRNGKDCASERPKTVLMGRIERVCVHMANYIGDKEASVLCRYFKLSTERSQQILYSLNPGLEVIVFLIKRNEKCLEEILIDLLEATYELSLQEVNYILFKFITQVYENGDQSILKRRYELKSDKCEGTLNNDELGSSEFDLQFIREMCKITCQMKILECQSSLPENDVFVFNLEPNVVNEWNGNITVNVITKILTIAISANAILFGQLYFLSSFKAGLWSCLAAVDLWFEFVFLYALLLELSRIILAVGDMKSTLSKMSLINSQLHFLPRKDTTEQLFTTRLYLKSILQSFQQQQDSSTSLVENLEDCCQILTITYDFIKVVYANHTEIHDKSDISSDDFHLRDAVVYIMNNINVLHRSLVQSLYF